MLTDPQYQALDAVTTVEDPELGPLRMQNVLFRLSATPGAIRWTGRPHGADTDGVLTELGLTADELNSPARGGSRVKPPPLTLLYAPADRPEPVAKALAGRADVVIVDLEDAVAADGKEQARAATPCALGSPAGPVQIRVNALEPSTPGGPADRGRPLGRCGLRLPKVTARTRSPCRRERARSVAAPRLHPCWSRSRPRTRLRDRPADPAVASIGLGEADLRADLGSATTRASTGRGRGSWSPPVRPGCRPRPVGLPRHPRPGRPGRVVPRPYHGLPRPGRHPPAPAPGHRGGLPADEEELTAARRS